MLCFAWNSHRGGMSRNGFAYVSPIVRHSLQGNILLLAPWCNSSRFLRFCELGSRSGFDRQATFSRGRAVLCTHLRVDSRAAKRPHRIAEARSLPRCIYVLIHKNVCIYRCFSSGNIPEFRAKFENSSIRGPSPLRDKLFATGKSPSVAVGSAGTDTRIIE
jgi:hypothetical protein